MRSFVQGSNAPLRPLDTRTGWLVILFWFVCTFLGAVWFAVDNNGIYFFFGALACLVLSAPLGGTKPYDLLSPWSLLLIGAYVGYGIRGLFISLGINGTRTIDALFLLGQQPAYFIWPSSLFILGALFLTLGFSLGRTRRNPSYRPLVASETMSGPRVQIAVLLCAIIGFIAFYQFAQSTGGFSLARFSAKRTLINSGHGLSASYESHGGLRFINVFSSIAFWLQLAWYAHKGHRMTLWTLRGLWLLVLLVNAALLPTFASTRSDVVFIIVTGLFILLSIKGTRISWRTLAAVAVGTLAVLTVLTTARMQDQGNASARVGGQTLVDALVLSRTVADIPTSSHIIRAVPERLPYSDGGTIAQWVLAPVPRSVWPGKPIISQGPEIAIAIYGDDKTGIPPGVFAESYWNFGVGGMIVLPLLAGYFMSRFNEGLTFWARTSPSAAVLMCAVSLRVGIDLTTNGIGYALFQVISGIVLLLPVLLFCASRTSEATKRTGPAQTSPGERLPAGVSSPRVPGRGQPSHITGAEPVKL